MIPDMRLFYSTENHMFSTQIVLSISSNLIFCVRLQSILHRVYMFLWSDTDTVFTWSSWLDDLAIC